MIKVIYWNAEGIGIEIPSESFKENEDGPLDLDSKVAQEIISIESASGLVFYFVRHAEIVTDKGYNSVVVLNQRDKSIRLILDIERSKIN